MYQTGILSADAVIRRSYPRKLTDRDFIRGYRSDRGLTRGYCRTGILSADAVIRRSYPRIPFSTDV